MAASDMMSALMELCQEKHIDQLYLIDRLEQSLAKSYAEILHLDWGAKVTIDRTTGKIYVYRLEPIDDSMDEEGNFTEFEEIDVTPKNTSRIAAQLDDAVDFLESFRRGNPGRVHFLHKRQAAFFLQTHRGGAGHR